MEAVTASAILRGKDQVFAGFTEPPSLEIDRDAEGPASDLDLSE